MNKFAYLFTGYAIKKLNDFTKAKINVSGEKNIPDGSIIFVINHFTRIETLFLPYYIHQATKVPVWSLADSSLFKGALGSFLSTVGALSTKDPDRDKLIVKSLLTGEANWIIFPEGLMVKTKKIIEDGKFMMDTADGRRPPHTGAANLALRTEFYRQRIKQMIIEYPSEVERLLKHFEIEAVDPILTRETYIVPVNLTYYPVRSRENIISTLAERFVEEPSERMREEIMTEGTMLLSGVDIDLHYGEPVKMRPYLKNPFVEWDLASKREVDFDKLVASKDVLKESSVEIMNHYMSSIYEMTVVNHDHLFATMLNQLPEGEIDEYELRARVYLSANLEIDGNGYYKHASLRQNQIHLLTDDRFDKYKNFISLCIDKGLVEYSEDVLIKKFKDFNQETEYDFHTLRYDNPVAVMANEIEPLSDLHPHLFRLAKEPGAEIRRRLISTLMRQTISNFDSDYEVYFDKNESKPKEIGMPFLSKGDSRRVGILLIHGYMAAPEEVKGLAKYLSDLGYWVYAPRLRGHGTLPDDLANRSYMDWVESVEEGFTILKNMCTKVVVGGFSTGAGLALDIVSRVEGVDGVFAVAPPMKLQDFSSKFVPAVDTWNQWMQKVKLSVAKKEFVENFPENPHINYSRNPISGIRQLEKLMDDLRPKLEDIMIPALVIQSRKDPVVNPKGSRNLFDRLGSEKKEYFLFDIDRHGILLGREARRVYRAVGDFVDDVLIVEK